jgi:hypothetical protein
MAMIYPKGNQRGIFDEKTHKESQKILRKAYLWELFYFSLMQVVLSLIFGGSLIVCKVIFGFSYSMEGAFKGTLLFFIGMMACFLVPFLFKIIKTFR